MIARGGPMAGAEAYRAVFECANDAIFLVDAGSGAVVEMNRRAQELLGRTPEEVVGRPCVAMFPPEDVTRCQLAFQEHVQQGRALTADMRVLHADGHAVPVDVSSALFELEGRSTLCCVFRDMSERRALEERLERSRQLEAITRVASGVAHDVNNLLSGLVGLLELMGLELEPPRPPDLDAARSLLGDSQALARQAAGLASSLLGLRRRAEQREHLDLRAVVAAQRGPLSRLLGARVRLELEESGQELPVLAERSALEQVLLNLVLNAAEASPPGGVVRVELAARPLQVEPGRACPGVALRVSDQGAGIRGEDLPRIFEPFFTTKPAGTGLGLALVDSLVRRLGGRVEVVSAPGEGASFTVVLPRAATAAATAAAT